MLVEGEQPIGVVLIDQLSPVAAAAGARCGAGDNGWNGADVAVPAGDLIGSREQAGQRHGLIRHVVGARIVAGLAVRDAVGRIGGLDVMLVFHSRHGVSEVDVANVERLERVDRVDIRVDRSRLHFQM